MRDYISTDGCQQVLRLTNKQRELLDTLEGTVYQKPVQIMWIEQQHPDWAAAYLQGALNALAGAEGTGKLHFAWEYMLRECLKKSLTTCKG